MSNVVTQLPPTIGIKDPEVRAYLDALTNAWSLRSGDINSDAPERYVTAGEFEEMAGKAIIGALGSAVPGWTTGTTGGSVAQAVSSLSEEIKRSILYQILGTQFGQIDLAAMQARVDAAFQSANTLFAEERLQRENAVESVTEQINIQASRLGQAESAITSEASTRATKDDAIAAAVNRIWAEIGGTQAAIQDGQLAAVSPSAAQATKWQQVQVALTDPATGQVMQTAIKQELNSYANKADGTLNSIYSVRAQLTQDGRTIVGGFGLAATGGAGSPQGPTIDFGVRADRFFIARTAQTPDLATQLDGANDDVPFIVVTTPQTINGQLYPPGVYLKSAFIVDASIDSAKIRDLAVTRAKIGSAAIGSAQIDSLAVGRAHIQDLAVDTLKIAGNAVTIPSSAYTKSRIQLSYSGSVANWETSNEYDWLMTEVQRLVHNSSGAPTFVFFSGNFETSWQAALDEGLNIKILRNNEIIYTASNFYPGLTAVSVIDNIQTPQACIYRVLATAPTGNNVFFAGSRSLLALEVKR